MDGGKGGRCGRVVRWQRDGGRDFEHEDGERLKWWGVEECGRQGVFGRYAEVSEAFVDGHFVDEFVDMWDVRFCGQANSRKE